MDDRDVLIPSREGDGFGGKGYHIPHELATVRPLGAAAYKALADSHTKLLQAAKASLNNFEVYNEEDGRVFSRLQIALKEAEA